MGKPPVKGGKPVLPLIFGDRMYMIIVGAGKIGEAVADWAREMKDDIVVIDKEKGKCEEFGRKYDAAVINADATVRETLEDAGIERADALVATADDDTTNLVVTEIARKLNSEINLVSIVNDEDKLKLYKSEKRNVITVNKKEVIGDRLYGAAIGLGPGFIGFRKVKYGKSVEDTDFVMFQTLPLPTGLKKEVGTFGKKKWRTQGMSIRVIERDGKIITRPSGRDNLEKEDRLTIIAPIDLVSKILRELGFSESIWDKVKSFFKKILSKAKKQISKDF